MSRYTLHQGDCRDVLKSYPDNSFDSIVTDAPYGLSQEPDMAEVLRHWLAGDDYGGKGRGFMGKAWDSFVPSPTVWREALRVLKPGGHLFCFFGTRTYDLGVIAIRLAGFEVRDQFAWVYGEGMPKAQLWSAKKAEKGDADSARMIAAGYEGWARGGVKPAWEPICLARKPLAGTVIENVLRHGVGALNIDACRVPTSDMLREGAGTTWAALHQGEGRPDPYRRNFSGDRGHFGTRDNTETGATNFRVGGGSASELGRFPANLIHDGSSEVVELFPAEAGAAAPVTVRNADKFRGTYGEFGGHIDEAGSTFHADTGSAARFFAACPLDEEDRQTARFLYCGKASRDDRNEGCESLPRRAMNWSSGEKSPGTFQSPNTDRASPNHHPTVKLTAVMRWLVRLVTPKRGRVADIFMGSGSTGKACMLEGFDFVGIDLDRDDEGRPLGYIDIARARIEHAARMGHQPGLLEAA